MIYEHWRHILFDTSILIYVLVLLIGSFTIIPLQIREARVKNGLAKLRKQILAFGYFMAIIIAITLIILISRFFIPQEFLSYVILVLVFIHSLGFLAITIIGYLIYHQQYTPENIKLHAKIQKMEDKIDKEKKAE